MARPPRDFSAGTFHVTAHAVWGNVLFRDSIDYLVLCAELAATIARSRWRCIAFCFLGTHLHLLLEVEDDALPTGMQRLNNAYARNFNRRYGLRGHVFAKRYYAGRIDTEEHLLTAFRYVVRNPVEANLCTMPGDWGWSSYAGTVGLAEPFGFVDASPVVDCFGRPAAAALQRLRDFVEAP
ncbi:MAG TPA: transposase [Gaiellaceae bacterium]|nr:transposase [Gaiellaceae bacterium]